MTNDAKWDPEMDPGTEEMILWETETNDRLLVSCTKPSWRRETIRCFNSTAAHQK